MKGHAKAVIAKLTRSIHARKVTLKPSPSYCQELRLRTSERNCTAPFLYPVYRVAQVVRFELGHYPFNLATVDGPYGKRSHSVIFRDHQSHAHLGLAWVDEGEAMLKLRSQVFLRAFAG